MRDFFGHENGNIAVTFALAALPLFSAVGMAVDYTRAVNVRSFVQSQSDIAALSAAQLGPEGNPKAFLEYLRFVTEQRYGKGEWIDRLSIEAKWLSSVDYSVTVRETSPSPSSPPFRGSRTR